MAVPAASDRSRWRQTPGSEASASQRASAPCYGSTEDVGGGAVVVAPLEFRDVERQILAADVVECADDAALQQRPETVNCAGVHLAAHVFALAVVNRFVDTALAHAIIDVRFIGRDQINLGRYGFVDGE